jgi:hypothetical protein
VALFVTLSQGRTGATARAILATDDPRVVRATLRALERRLRGDMADVTADEVPSLAEERTVAPSSPAPSRPLTPDATRLLRAIEDEAGPR